MRQALNDRGDRDAVRLEATDRNLEYGKTIACRPAKHPPLPNFSRSSIFGCNQLLRRLRSTAKPPNAKSDSVPGSGMTSNEPVPVKYVGSEVLL